MKLKVTTTLLLLSNPCLAAEAVIEARNIYQMDIFSIISFALAIAAFIVSIFMGWLSWEFYKKSTEASDKTQQAVTKIETAVLSIQSEITEIVRRAVGYWTGDATPDVVSDQGAALAEKFEELSVKIQALNGAEGSKADIESKLSELIQLQRDQVATLTSSVVDAKAKALFPSIDRGPVSLVTQSTQTNGMSEKSGELIINVIRPSKIATATGKFSPAFEMVPDVSVDLIASPSSDMSNLSITVGVGKPSDFNVHLIGKSGLLETGTYVIRYSARAKDDEHKNT